MNILFDEADIVYEKSISPTITRHRIEYPTLGNFCVGINGFYTQLGDLVTEEYWKKFLSRLKHIRFCLCAAPLPKDYRFERITAIDKDLHYHLRYCRNLFPDLADQAFSMLNLLRELLDDPKDPLLDKLVELTNSEKKNAWVIKESRLIPCVEELVSELNLGGLNVIHPLQLKNLTCFDKIIFVGPSRWYPESVFTAPRASQLDIVIFDWINDRWEPLNVFVESHKSTGPSNRKYTIIEENEISNRWDDIDPESLLLLFDRSLSVAALFNKADQDEYENVEAVCVFLEGDWAVFVEVSEGSTTMVIDPDEVPEDRISRVNTEEIKPGIFILVRTSGGGDYIVPVADKIMGKAARQARECQRRWKELLRSCVRRKGLTETSIDLIDCGSNIANEINVRNWMSPRSIGTRKYNDFSAIMKLIGLEKETQEYWTMIKRINRAHHKAGFEIRNLLLDQVKDIQIDVLQKQGKMDFKLSSDDEGGLTAFRVEGLMSESLEVPYSRIGQPFSLEDQLWHE